MPTLAPIATVLVDEAHAQAWTIRPDVARAIQPAHPEDSSYAAAADALRRRGFAVEAHTGGPLTDAGLAGADVLVLPHGSEARWERVVPGGSPQLTEPEIDAGERFVARGGAPPPPPRARGAGGGRAPPGAPPQPRGPEFAAVGPSAPGGGGLLVRGGWDQENSAPRLNDLLARFGFHPANDTVSDYVAHHR